MKLLQLLNQAAGDQRTAIITAALVAALAEVSLLIIVAQAAAYNLIGSPAPVLIGLFVVLISLDVMAGLYAYRRIAQVLEGFIYQLRQRLAGKIRTRELLALEQLDTDDALNCLTQETVIVSQSTNVLAALLRDGFITAFAGLYLLAVSIPAFIIWLGAIALGSITFRRTFAQRAVIGAQAAIQATAFFTGLHHLLEGFKQIKLNRCVGDQLLQEIDTAAAANYQAESQVDREFAALAVSYVSTLYLSLAVLVFGLPRLLPIASETLYESLTAMLFAIAPITSLLRALPILSRADFALQRLLDLEQRLDRSAAVGGYGVTAETPCGANFSEFQTLSLEQVVFHYPGEAGDQFAVGPLSLTIRAGEMLFIVGGNGSGKSTLIKLLMGLYPPQAGEILVDDRPVTGATLLDYREIFSAIFFDHYLFAKPYGLGTLEPQAVNRLIADMQIQRVTQFTGEQFSNLKLSTGQQKRLAMVVARLEQRPIYVFDEWAAGQDPEFRTYFYQQLLPELHNQGKTIIVITHDDQFLAGADRVIKMELGQVVADSMA